MRAFVVRIAPAWVLAGCLGIGATARAQDATETCASPDAAGSMTAIEAGEQALCWLDLHRRRAPSCSAREGTTSCALDASAWCDRAALDASPQIANACFLAWIAAGRFDDAARVAPILTETWPDALACARAFTHGLTLDVTSTPSGAAVLVSGRRAATTPAQVELPAPWWERSLAVRFGRGDDAETIGREPDVLRATFDRDHCTLAPIAIERPPRPVVRRGRPVPARVARRRPHTRGRTRPTPWGPIGVIAAGTTAVVVGVALLVAADVQAADLRDVPDGTAWTPDRRDTYDAIPRLWVAGGIVAGVGAACDLVGVLLLLTRGSGTATHRARSGPRLRVGAGTLSLEGTL